MIFSPSFLILLFTLSAGINAAPWLESRSGVSNDVFARLKFFAQYAAAAYCAKNNNSPGDKVVCSSKDQCPQVQQASTKTVAEFQNSRTADTTGFVAIDSTNRLIVVSFRGSHSIRNWVTDATFDLQNSQLCPGCQVHTGFWNAWKEARPKVLPALQKAVAANPKYQVVVTGHSLGAAIATLAAAELRNLKYNVALYAYASPRVGTGTTASYISSQPGGNYRVSHIQDVVPHVPLSDMRYAHITPEYYITVRNKVPVAPNDVSQLSGPSQPNGELSLKHLFETIPAHSWYFVDMSLCHPNDFFKRQALVEL